MNTPDILSFDTYRNCILCPRMCKADRSRAAGYCGCSSVLTAARAALHHWEEPCISGSIQYRRNHIKPHNRKPHRIPGMAVYI